MAQETVPNRRYTDEFKQEAVGLLARGRPLRIDAKPDLCPESPLQFPAAAGNARAHRKCQGPRR